MRVVAIAFLRAANFARGTHVPPYREYVMDKQFTVVRRYLPCIRACIMHTEVMHRGRTGPPTYFPFNPPVSSIFDVYFRRDRQQRGTSPLADRTTITKRGPLKIVSS